MKNKISLLIVLWLCITSCSANQIEERQEKQVDFSHLKIQKVLNKEDKSYYNEVHNRIGEIGKHFAFREENADKKYCPVIENMFNEVSKRHFSRDREREKERVRNSLIRMCHKPHDFSFTNQHILNYEEYKYLASQIKDSAQIFSNLASTEFRFAEENKSNKVISQKYKILFQDHFQRSFDIDPLDINSYLENLDVISEGRKQEYCQKAIDTMQWDHIYYISNWYADTGSLVNILKDDSIQNNPCIKVVKLALSGWSKEHLYSSEMINPTADEFRDPNQYQTTQKELRDLMKKRLGRDLDKEPKVSDQQY